MRFPRIALSLFALTMLIVLPTACSSGAPASLGDVPVFAGAEPADASANYITDAMVTSIEQSIAKQNLASEVSLYRLPEGTQWDAVKQFYTTEINDGWEPVPELTQEAGVINIIGWQRGSGASEQILIAGQAEDPTSGETFLLLGLFSE